MTVQEKKNLVRWFCNRAFQRNRETARVDVVQIYDAMSAVDDWFDAAPALGGSTNQAQLVAALPMAFAQGSTATQKSLILAAVVLGRTGSL